MASSAGPENAENKGSLEHDPIRQIESCFNYRCLRPDSFKRTHDLGKGRRRCRNAASAPFRHRSWRLGTAEPNYGPPVSTGMGHHPGRI